MNGFCVTTVEGVVEIMDPHQNQCKQFECIVVIQYYTLNSIAALQHS